jgi:hypothetical protein
MNDRTLRTRWLRAVAAVTAWLGACAAAGAQPASLEPRVTVGKSLSPTGALLSRAGIDRTWDVVAEKEAVASRDLLLALPGGRAVVEPRPKSVHLTLWGNLPQLSAFPGLDSAVVLHDSRAYDLDFTLVRGRVLVTNRKDKGAARVWVRLPGQAWELSLAEPGDEAALELYGRWPRGTSFNPKRRPQDGPTSVAVLLVLKGQVDLKTGATRQALSAPPGPAYFHWDSTSGVDEGPQRRTALPPWADPKVAIPAEGKTIVGVLSAFRERLKKKAPEAALADVLSGADADKDKARAALARQFAVLSLAALDAVDQVAEALDDAKRTDVRSAAVMALRNWIGEAGDRDLQLYRVLTDQLRYPAAPAETVMQLLHSPFDPDQPETYETLLAYLSHGRLAVRELAHWHLSRLKPEGRKFNYDPAGPEAERKKACAAWKEYLRKPKEEKKPG